MQTTENLEQQLASANAQISKLRERLTAWTVVLVVGGLLFGAWYSGQHARDYYLRGQKEGYEAGLVAPDAERDEALAHRARLQDQTNCLLRRGSDCFGVARTTEGR